MRDSRLSEGLRWLEQAEADRHGAQVLLDAGVFHLACFHAQQVAEKATKAFLYASGEDVVIGHSVEALCRWAAGYDEQFEQLRETVGALDANYIPTRYPNGLPDNIPARVYGRPEAERALGMCDQLLDVVRSRLTRQ